MKKRITIRIILTIGLCAIFKTITYAYALFESPIRGAANAQMLSDSLPAYGVARFVSGNGIETFTGIVFILLLGIIWLSLLTQKN